MLPSSISAPSTLVPMISAVSGRTTENPNAPRNSAGHTGLTATSLSTTVISSRTTGTSRKTSARLRPSVARSVIRSTTGFTGDAIRLTVPSRCHQVGEHALQRLVRRQHLAQRDAGVLAEPGKLTAERAKVGRPDLEPARGHLDAGD